MTPPSSTPGNREVAERIEIAEMEALRFRIRDEVLSAYQRTIGGEAMPMVSQDLAIFMRAELKAALVSSQAAFDAREADKVIADAAREWLNTYIYPPHDDAVTVGDRKLMDAILEARKQT